MMEKVLVLLFTLQLIAAGTEAANSIHCRPGSSPLGAGLSCRHIFQCYPESTSGLYWVRARRADGTYTIQRMYCSKETHHGFTGGFTRVALLNMTRTESKCPSSLRYVSAGGNRTICARKAASGGCSTVKYETKGVPYSMVCGRIKGYSFGSPKAFVPTVNGSRPGLRVDGILITHGPGKKYIWTYATGTSGGRDGACPCSYPQGSTYLAPLIGQDYYCESTIARGVDPEWNLEDPLWDGEGCNDGDYCYSRSGLPWFCKQLPVETRDDIDVHVCSGEPSNQVNIGIEEIELSVF